MAKLTFQDLKFEEKKDSLRVWFLRIFYFDLEKPVLGDAKASEHSIEFPGLDESSARRRFDSLMSLGFAGLKNSLTGKPTIYIHKNSGIPLIGNISFGIIDRNSSLIEVKPITGCNLKCIFCSVDQDKRLYDFVVEKDYLVQELRKLVEMKQQKGLEIHINSHGEPSYYAPLREFVQEVSKWPEIQTISIDTNATLLTEIVVDNLAKAGLTRFNVSLNAIDSETARKMAGCNYDVSKIKNICKHITKVSQLLIAPVLVPGFNEDEMPKLIEFADSLKSKIGIQNFLSYKTGKHPGKPYQMKKFFEILKNLQEATNIKLIFDENDFSIKRTKPLPKPFKKGQKIEAVLLCPGRLAHEMIAAAKGRNITIKDTDRIGIATIRITGDKHNIFYGSVSK
ncbi:MAG: radical SAM protein [Candidatus Woesearchaeota archaeon]